MGQLTKDLAKLEYGILAIEEGINRIKNSGFGIQGETIEELIENAKLTITEWEDLKREEYRD